ncbi:uncharacterized protein LOC126907528 [Daktulosphaira vitifoliae]|uniref:uncharacterized protein LOC126907528 n=1 Tax=Daktulosphaira vitifoliae TaxID=58002 RepID=UPI0021A9854B|nr:uncharacterized protein LOC126907528 [Daktulosphaira vitifoliae]
MSRRFKLFCLVNFILLLIFIYKLCTFYNFTQKQPYPFWLEQCKDAAWLPNQPIPLPEWGDPRDPYEINSINEYDNLNKSFENVLQTLLKTNNYDSLHNFIRFYKHYKSGNYDSLEEFFREYKPILTRDANNCVGLALLLLERLILLDQIYPGIKKCLYLVSCEMRLQNIERYEIRDNPDPWVVDKEHVLVAMKIKVIGRNGIMILDPGFQIGRVITVMNDGLSPHTDTFKAVSSPEKKYNYQIALDGKYLKWTMFDNFTKPEINLIYIDAAYITPVSVTERRNLISKFRSILSSSDKGHLLAGVYFKSNYKAGIHLFYEDEEDKKNKGSITVSPKYFISPDKIDSNVEYMLEKCSRYLRLPLNDLQNILTEIAYILEDEQFQISMLKIDNEIIERAKHNSESIDSNYSNYSNYS